MEEILLVFSVPLFFLLSVSVQDNYFFSERGGANFVQQQESHNGSSSGARIFPNLFL